MTINEAQMLNITIILLVGLAVAGIVYAGGLAFTAWFRAYETKYVERTEHDLYGMFSNVSPARILQASFVCFVVFFILVFLLIGSFETGLRTFLSLSISTMVGLIGSFLPRLIIKRIGVLRLRKFDLQLLDALLSMSNALKAGFSILQAFESVVQEGKNPIAQEFDLLLREIRMGIKFETASDNLAKRVPSDDLKIVLAGIETARVTGGNLTEVFDRLATVIRERMRINGRIQSLTAQGRMQGWVVGLMPLFLGIAIYYIQPGLIATFVQSPVGIALIFFILLLETVGFFVIRKIVTIDV